MEPLNISSPIEYVNKRLMGGLSNQSVGMLYLQYLHMYMCSGYTGSLTVTRIDNLTMSLHTVYIVYTFVHKSAVYSSYSNDQCLKIRI